jgi:hypothetical protein
LPHAGREWGAVKKNEKNKKKNGKEKKKRKKEEKRRLDYLTF